MASRIHRGDAFVLELQYVINGTPIEEYELDDIEFCIGSNTFLLSNGDIERDPETNKYFVFLDQEDTFKFNDIETYQIRIKKDNNVVAEDIKRIPVAQSKSRKVI